LHYAALANDVHHAEACIAAGDDPDASDEKGFTTLHFAAQEGAADVARMLLDGGAAVDQVNEFLNRVLAPL